MATKLKKGTLYDTAGKIPQEVEGAPGILVFRIGNRVYVRRDLDYRKSAPTPDISV